MTVHMMWGTWLVWAGRHELGVQLAEMAEGLVGCCISWGGSLTKW